MDRTRPKASEKATAYWKFLCNTNAGNEKGEVEGLVGFARRNFMVPIPEVSTLEELNELLEQECLEYARKTRVPYTNELIATVWEREKEHLLPIPKVPFDACRVVESQVDRQSLIRLKPMPILYLVNIDERLGLVEWGHPELSIKKQAELLNLNRSSLYYHPVPPSPEEIAKHRIDEIYTEFPFYGSRRITIQLRREGFLVNRKAVQRHMREMGIAAIYPKSNLSKRNHEHRVYPYLLRGLAITYPNQVWGIDITYIRLVRGWMYLVAIMDWYSRFVVSWALDQCLETAFVLVAVKEAMAKAKPEIMNSDQGAQFTDPDYIKLLEGAGIRISMDGKGRATDNIFTERLWRSLKYEEVYLNEYQNEYQSPREARQGISRYLEFYNYRRPHQSLKYKTPAEVYYGKSKTYYAKSGI